MLSNLSGKKNCARCGNYLQICLFVLYFFFKLRLLLKQRGFYVFLYTNWETACYLKKVLHFIQAQFCGPAIQGPREADVIKLGMVWWRKAWFVGHAMPSKCPPFKMITIFWFFCQYVELGCWVEPGDTTFFVELGCWVEPGDTTFL